MNEHTEDMTHSTASEHNIFEVDNLSRWFHDRGGKILSKWFEETKYIKAVDNVSFSIKSGEILGLAGQSGCGKSTLGELLLRLQEPTDGTICFEGEDITEFDKSQLMEFRRECQMIFQDPYESLNPRFPVSQTVMEPLKIHDIGTAEERDNMVMEALSDCGLRPPEKYLDQIPTNLSGGERQRVSLARAIVLGPSFVVADEPVSMLDVSVRTEILKLFEDLRRKRDLTMVYISHDLSTVSYLTDRTMIMYLGDLVEIGPTDEVVVDPSHPYTEQLISSMPSPELHKTREGSQIRGEVPDPVDLPQGCRFHPNCQYATDECRDEEPDLEPVSDRTLAACYHPVK